MIKIELDERSVFIYNRENNSIHIYDFRNGKWDGPTREIGMIKFCERWQVEQFHEMLEMLLEKGEWSRKDNE